ncbi:helix-turn-helix domain-containing protein [Oceanicella sp. SM1341]|uniref:helix-turn-helix domain-containing protein n=1 Tax=Oceanicella sp. SM1341 TaxID=1548889 RepID=UPI000E4779EA|nr:helix-turn-helix domain-containing protein [Oceanicella sp. SM1341]
MPKPEDPFRSPYDTEPEEQDLWFLPATEEEEGGPRPRGAAALPWETADRRPLLDPEDWLKAERAQGRALTAAAVAFARLDERLRAGPEGLVRRLALMDVSDLLWSEGVRIAPERLALYVNLRAGAPAEGDRELALAGWAFRRLLGGPGPLEGLHDFLGRRPAPADGLLDFSQRPVGPAFDGLAEDWRAVLERGEALHPISRAGCAFAAWRSFGLSGAGAVLEPAVVAARLGGGEGRALTFLPLAIGERNALRAGGGSPEERLAGWYRGIETACLRGYMELDRLTEWQRRASETLSDLSGRTPPALVAALLAAPVLSAEMAAATVGVSFSAAARNLALFEERGLVREVTGQERFRFWTVRA